MSRNIDNNSAHTAHRLAIGGLRSAAPALGVAWLVCCAIGFTAPLAAQEEIPMSGATAAMAGAAVPMGGAAVPCPAPEPRLETCTGWSLYWHDPCGQGYNCQDPILDHNSGRPSWFVMAEFMPLFRETRSLNLGGTLNLGIDDLDSEFAAGGRLLAGLSLGDWYRLEFSGLGCYSWSDMASVTGTNTAINTTSSTFTDTTTTGSGSSATTTTTTTKKTTTTTTTTNGFQSLAFSSELDDMQLNLRRRMAIRQNARYAFEASTILGLRYMRIDETLGTSASLTSHATSQTTTETSGSSTTTNGTPTDAASGRHTAVEANNSMFGVQIGALAQFLAREHGWIDFEIKGGILSNEAQVNSTHIIDAGVPSVFAGKETRTAFIGDLSLMFNYQFAPAWTFRAGYNAMWLTGLALGPDNTSISGPAPSSIDHDGNAVYHGPSISLIWAR